MYYNDTYCYRNEIGKIQGVLIRNLEEAKNFFNGFNDDYHRAVWNIDTGESTPRKFPVYIAYSLTNVTLTSVPFDFNPWYDKEPKIITLNYYAKFIYSDIFEILNEEAVREGSNMKLYKNGNFIKYSKTNKDLAEWEANAIIDKDSVYSIERLLPNGNWSEKLIINNITGEI